MDWQTLMMHPVARVTDPMSVGEFQHLAVTWATALVIVIVAVMCWQRGR